MTIDTKRLRELNAKATPPPWTGDRFDGTVKYDMKGPDGAVVIHGDNGNSEDGPYGTVLATDDALIMTMRNELPAILDRLERLEAVAEAATLAVDGIGNWERFESIGSDRLEHWEDVALALEALARLDGAA
jgi:hypothetical protein